MKTKASRRRAFPRGFPEPETTDVLRCLRQAGEKRVSGAALAARLGLTRAAVHKRVEKLRAAGYGISGVPRLGYRLSAAPDTLNLKSPAGSLGRPFFRHDVLPSTQDEAKRLALSGAAEGTLVAAERQTRGRGRLGRPWVSPPGGLWYSLVLRPSLSPGRVPALTLVAALDWARVIRRRTGLPAEVKWPNDVWIGGRKAAGVLAEMSSEADRVHWVVLGVGVNVNNPAPRGVRAPAASLSDESGSVFSRGDLLAAWLRAGQKSRRRY
ncbi:MAG: biotin--[acetyl-CoA-carboxylase] ligase, partial [Elusimicrobiota bacterium]